MEDVSRILNLLYLNRVSRATCKPEYATDLKSHKTNYTDDIVLNRMIISYFRKYCIVYMVEVTGDFNHRGYSTS